MTMIIVGSNNPVKLEAARRGVAAMLDLDPEVAGISVPSGVPEQPMTDSETLAGARNRAAAAKVRYPDADFWFGIEGGIEEAGEQMRAFAWVVVLGHGLEGEARTATFQLPPEIAGLVRDGVELGHADDRVFGRSNSKQKDGAIGILTDGLVDRTDYYAHAVMLALVPFRKRELYKKDL